MRIEILAPLVRLAKNIACRLAIALRLHPESVRYAMRYRRKAHFSITFAETAACRRFRAPETPMPDPWLLDGAVKDGQSITAQWTPSSMRLIDGVSVHEVLNVPKSSGYLTEILRGEWLANTHVDQVFQVVLEPGAISAWHAHATTTDRIFVSYGLVCVVLFDNREDSPTRGVVNDFRFGTVRPALVVVPPRVWRGLHNIAGGVGIILNLVDRAYAYEDPDHWRVPHGHPQCPVVFT
jgi:dTDP-4-dehydrorhamnose 3,5-epimerase